MDNVQQPTPYQIYGRQSYAQPLTYIQTTGSPTLESLPLAEGEEWVEVAAFPVSAVIRVIPREPRDPQQKSRQKDADEHG